MSGERDTRGPVSNWLAYATSLPTDDPPARMRVLRRQDSLGCAVLREGVYLLPELDKSQECPSTAVGFGFDGAAFANSKSGVTFEKLLANFGLQDNAALARFGALVHYLDTGGSPVAEAAGVETLLLGAQRRSSGADGLFAESKKTFDLLYEEYTDGPEKT